MFLNAAEFRAKGPTWGGKFLTAVNERQRGREFHTAGQQRFREELYIADCNQR